MPWCYNFFNGKNIRLTVLQNAEEKTGTDKQAKDEGDDVLSHKKNNKRKGKDMRRNWLPITPGRSLLFDSLGGEKQLKRKAPRKGRSNE